MKKSEIKISRQLRDIIHGYIMSDGYVKPCGSLTVDQSKKQEKFVEWLYEKLKPIRTEHPISDVFRYPSPSTSNPPTKSPPALQGGKKGGKGGTSSGVRVAAQGSKGGLLSNKSQTPSSHSRRFNTRNVLRGFHFMWYKPYVDSDKNGTTKTLYLKRLPKSLDAFFSPVFISLWFAGDGTKVLGSKGARFEVTSFSPEERQRLKKLFEAKYGILANITRAGTSKRGTEQWNLSINSGDYDKFKKLITQIDLIPTLFPHKLH